MNIFKVLSLFVFMFPAVSFATWDNSISLSEVAQSKGWLKLLHYREAWTTDYKSLVDGEDFFFADNGKRDPEAELKASLEAMSKDIKVGKLKQHPQCAFPYRYLFLKKTMKLDVPEQKCEKFEAFFKGFNNPKSISIVYSSAYPNNPASMFGHLLIKINSERNNPLLDSGMNYAAVVPDDENPFAFFYFGVFGGYIGSYTHQPYYVKVNTYVNFESRDLWEYELTFDKEEVRNFIAHLWEIETNSFYWYYFFDENCAHQILMALEAIRPDWEVSDHNVAAVPGEMIKKLAFTPDAIKEVHFRPSHYKQAMQVLNALNDEEEDDFLKVIQKDIPPTEAKHRLSLDASIRYVEYLRNEKKAFYERNYKDFRKTLLSARAKLGMLTDEEKGRLPEIPKETRPDLGHDVAAFVTSYGTNTFSGSDQTSEFFSLKFRSAYHDLLNSDRGMIRYGQIEFPSLEVRYYDDEEHLMIEELGMLKSMSLHPLSTISQKFSWKIDTRIAPAKDYGCLNCRHIMADGGLGGSLNLFNRRHIAYLLGTFSTELYNGLPLGYRLGPGVETGFLVNPSNVKLQVGLKRTWYLDPKTQPNDYVDSVKTGIAWHLERNWELRQTGLWVIPSSETYPQQFETFLSLYYFFH